MSDIHIVVLAAGKGTRMRSALPKVLHQAAGLPLLGHVLRTAAALDPASITVVVGHEAGAVRAWLAEAHPAVATIEQTPQLGTGHALLQTAAVLESRTGTVLLLSGDVPLLSVETVRHLLAAHEAEHAAATVLTAVVDRPDGYGRVVRDAAGHIDRIVEHRDATASELAIREINTGVYAFALEPLFPALRGLGSANAQGEYYLPDLVRAYRQRGLTVGAVTVADPAEIGGVNSRADLAAVAAALRRRKNAALMDAGVTLVDPSTTWIDDAVSVGPDTIIYPNVYLQGRTSIGSRCTLQSGVRLIDSAVGDEVLIDNHCVIERSRIDDRAQVGPFAHLRPLSHVGERAHVGNFVELKKTHLGKGSKANHLSYLGDATIGERVNIGAGTITCNYDGTSKHPTVIEDGAFIGSDSQLVAPVRIGAGAYIAAGSSITQDVPPGALGIARGMQVNKEGWVSRVKGTRG
jgi:bifunctional UDP-N-acetylglucosamine pyrophosphorylase/glucosamine-1-phosphate N-acetyltransferase